jgi:hypothetical protein
LIRERYGISQREIFDEWTLGQFLLYLNAVKRMSEAAEKETKTKQPKGNAVSLLTGSPSDFARMGLAVRG